MNTNQELYHDEIESLRRFRSKIETHAIYKEDLDDFSDEYEELVAQAKVITRVSDRLQKKLDNANMQIREQNEEIKDKNVQLADTVDQLAKAKVGRRASTILFTVAVVLFILEQVLLEPIIDEYFDTQFVSLGILGLLFMLVKFSEGALESYFMNKEKKKILANEQNNIVDVSKS
ncbi:hypothetical protein [Ekhidna sp.]|uniref:hypothetical protein n=1 Tax=Ekhidna sp. TaxID=2608089 RepID=UPI003B506BE2